MYEGTLTMGEILGDLISEKGVKKEEVAKAIGCSKSLISDIINEKKKQGITSTTLIKLCNYFNISSDYLLGLTPHRTTDVSTKEILEYTGLSEEALKNLSCWAANESVHATTFHYSQMLSNLIECFEFELALRRASSAISLYKYLAIEREVDETLTGSDLLNAEKIITEAGCVAVPFCEAVEYYTNQAANYLIKAIEKIGGKKEAQHGEHQTD